MRFSPALISSILIYPLRVFFSNYAGPDLKFDIDPKNSKIEIDSLNNLNKEAIQPKPRILVNRGTYTVDRVGMSNNLAEGKSPIETKGLKDSVNMVMITGQAQIMIEARHEGTMELITDMVSHFIVWSRPAICNTQGFKEFAMPLSVSDPRLSKEDREIFQTVIMVPYIMEEHWKVNDDAIKINNIYLDLKRQSSS